MISDLWSWMFLFLSKETPSMKLTSWASSIQFSYELLRLWWEHTHLITQLCVCMRIKIGENFPENYLPWTVLPVKVLFSKFFSLFTSATNQLEITVKCPLSEIKLPETGYSGNCFQYWPHSANCNMQVPGQTPPLLKIICFLGLGIVPW